MNRVELAAGALSRRFQTLQLLKYSPRSGGVSTGAPPPKRRDGKSPVPITLLDVDVDVSTKLHELHVDVARSLGVKVLATREGSVLATWFQIHADTITRTIDWTDDLADNLESLSEQIHNVIEVCQPQEVRVPSRVPRLVTAKQAARILSAKVATVSPTTVRRWGSDGHVRIVSKVGKHNVYDMVELQAHLKKVRHLSQ